MRLLCVEPTKSYRKLLRAAFKEAGIDAVFHESGTAALQDLDNEHYEFITISFYLNDMTAIELIKKIRANSKYRIIPIILITSESSEGLLHRALGVGVTDIFHKDEIDSLVIFLKRFSRNRDPLDGKVLCVEDTESQQQLIKAQLEGVGLSVDCCSSIEEAWQSFQANDYDLIITDIVFEKDLGGIKLVNNVRRFPTEKGDTPILAMSAYDDPVRRIEILNRGANEYITKPILEEELIARVRGLISNKKYLDSIKNDYAISERKRRSELQMLHLAVDMQEHVVFIDANKRIEKANSAFLNFVGFTDEEIIKKPFAQFVPKANEALFPVWETLNKNGTWHGDLWLTGKNQSLCLLQVKVTALKNEDDTVSKYVLVGVDITKRRELEVDLMRHQNYDQLTSLCNRSLLLDLLAQDVSRSKRLGYIGALLYVDLDNFKSINDFLGHQVGDGLLKQVAERLIELRKPEDVIARLGGDDFAILLTEIGKDSDTAADVAVHFAKNVQQELAKPFTVFEQEIETQATIGITLYPAQQANVFDILRQADAARYQAKSRGKSSIAFFSEELQDEVDERARIENLLRHAIENNELYLNFQPIYENAKTIVGCEVLLRWKLNTGEHISPGVFIPIAETTGLMERIGEWVMQEALAAFKRWQQQGLPESFKFLAINCSARQFRQENFVSDVFNMAQETGVDPTYIELEITETLLMDDLVATIKKMEELKAFGFRFAIDDFGTGFSSLRYLKQLPIDKLKIDQSFVRDIATDKNDLTIVETIIAMAHAMQLSVVAEGVETEEQCELLNQRQCNLIQGYLYSRPVSEQECYKLIEENTPKKLANNQ